MINAFLKIKTRGMDCDSVDIADIEKSDKVLFSLFTRYGDTIINLAVIKEFIDYYPNKTYLILCPRQMKPYVSGILPHIHCFTLNKRNLFDMVKVNRLLKNFNPDIGFNPWSMGLDSCYFLMYCKKYLCYKDFKRPKEINHYEVVEKYLNLPKKKWSIKELTLMKNYKNILICPQSTDLNRSLSTEQLDVLIGKLKKRYPDSKIIIASMNKDDFRIGCNHFLFSKSSKSSQQFFNIVKGANLVVCVDSGPFHIASILRKDILAIFFTTKPEIVVKSDTTIKIIKEDLCF